MSTINGDNVVKYDGLGRRIENFAGTGFLYDGWNAVQELSGTTVTANRMTGSVDEFFSRSDSTGSYYPLSDALGGTLDLTNSSGGVVASYSYEPFGNTTVTGSSSSVYQYTGRENEGNGLYYYRARYYSPILGRFISEDPIGFNGGVNFYRYVNDDPMTLIDRTGLDVTVSKYPGSFPNGFGHIGVGVNSDETWGFWETCCRDTLAFGRTVPGQVIPDASKGDTPATAQETITIPTAPDQDAAIETYIQHHRKNPGNYNLYGRQCTNFVADALAAGGLPVDQSCMTPECLIRDIKKRYGHPNIYDGDIF